MRTKRTMNKILSWFLTLSMILSMVPSMAFAAAAAGADGIMVEVHNNPSCALCDGAQSLTPEQFAALNTKVQQIREVIV